MQVSEKWHMHFNSQPHKEADGKSWGFNGGMKDISTHSLTRRLTGFDSVAVTQSAFQLTASQGG